jgi:hypothetical protein
MMIRYLSFETLTTPDIYHSHKDYERAGGVICRDKSIKAFLHAARGRFPSSRAVETQP